MRESKFLESSKADIPSFVCKEGCTDCCGPVMTTKNEAALLNIEFGSLTNIDGSIHCQFKSDDGCTVYDNRPMMCRLFGSSELDELKCPHGCKPKKPLSKIKTSLLLSKYRTFVIIDQTKVNFGKKS